MIFEDLEIYSKAIDLSDEIYDACMKFPSDEVFGLSSQIKRASISIFSNIAEGYGKESNRDFRKFLFISKGSLNEVKAQIKFAHRRNFISLLELNKIILKIDNLGRKLTYFIKNMNV